MLKNLRKSLLGSLLAAVAAAFLCFPSPARAQVTGGGTVFSFTAQNLTLGGTSPAAASTVVGTPVIGLDGFSKCVIYAVVQGATGGVLDIYIQSSVSQGAASGWYDVAHFTQLAAAGAQVAWVITIARGGTATAPVSVNKVDGTPVLAANTFVPFALGDALRVVYVAGASTSAGAAQSIQAICSTL